ALHASSLGAEHTITLVFPSSVTQRPVHRPSRAQSSLCRHRAATSAQGVRRMALDVRRTALTLALAFLRCSTSSRFPPSSRACFLLHPGGTPSTRWRARRPAHGSCPARRVRGAAPPPGGYLDVHADPHT